MINKNLKDNDALAIGFYQHNTRLGFDGSDFISKISISPTPKFWMNNKETLAGYISLEAQKELYENYGVDKIEVYKHLSGPLDEGEGKNSEYMMVQQYYIDPIKKNLGVIEFIRVKHSDF